VGKTAFGTLPFQNRNTSPEAYTVFTDEAVRLYQIPIDFITLINICQIFFYVKLKIIDKLATK
jgi:hypothetical protein